MYRPISRDMLTIDRSSSTNTPKVIDFVDPDIETGVVIKSFLEICLYQRYTSLEGPTASAIIGLVLKYEFKIELDRIELALLRQMQKREAPDSSWDRNKAMSVSFCG
jgi:hypothetical protein